MSNSTGEMTVRVRFTAWQKKSVTEQGDNGHLTMVDYTDGVTLEYGMVWPKDNYYRSQPKPDPLTDAPGRPLFVIGGTENFQISWQSSRKAISPYTGAKFEWVFWLDTDIPGSELKKIERLAYKRNTSLGRYIFKKEDIKSTYHARCLTILEDLAKMRGTELCIGSAREVLEDFAKIYSKNVYYCSISEYKGFATPENYVKCSYSPK